MESDGDTTTESDDTTAELLRAYLAGRDVECPQCQYNVRDLTGDRCPECGEKIVLRLNLAEPRLATLIAGLIGLSAGAGFSGLLLIYILIQVMFRSGWHNSREFWHFFLITALGLVIEGPAAIWWIRNWRRIRQKSSATRALLVAACWILSLVNIVVFSLGIR